MSAGYGAAAGQVLGSILSFAGQMKQASATKRAGIQENLFAKSEAGQLQAAGQRAGMEEERKAALLSSRALAVASASGAGAADPTATKIMADITSEGAYRKGVALYDYEERARLIRARGAITEDTARQKATAQRMQAYASLLSQGSSMYSNYAGAGGGEAGALAIAG